MILNQKALEELIRETAIKVYEEREANKLKAERDNFIQRTLEIEKEKQRIAETRAKYSELVQKVEQEKANPREPQCVGYCGKCGAPQTLHGFTIQSTCNCWNNGTKITWGTGK